MITAEKRQVTERNVFAPGGARPIDRRTSSYSYMMSQQPSQGGQFSKPCALQYSAAIFLGMHSAKASSAKLFRVLAKTAS